MNHNPFDLFCGPFPLFLRELPVPPTLRLAVLAPHPDDFDAIGATMRFFHQNGNQIHLGVATSSAGGVEDGFGGCFTSGAKAALRESEQQASCRYFGLPENRLTFLRLDESIHGHPEASAANLERIQSYLAASNPDLVFLPHGNDPNEGHRRTYALVRQSLQGIKRSMMACLNRDPKTIAMRYDLAMLFDTKTAAWKAELLRCHRSQHQRNLNTRGHGFDERILRVNRKIAASLGRPGEYAEAFELERHG